MMIEPPREAGFKRETLMTTEGQPGGFATPGSAAAHRPRRCTFLYDRSSSSISRSGVLSADERNSRKGTFGKV